ncbi:hypothetical protein GW17_00025711 [Ensete ventricosum]|nr:hypothetical protein GW17_00025711 [Ensete ventricosum]
MHEPGRAGSSRGPGNLTLESGPVLSRIRVGFCACYVDTGYRYQHVYRRIPYISFRGAHAIKCVEWVLPKQLAALIVSEHGRRTHVYSYGWPDSVDNAQKSEVSLLHVLPGMGPKGPIFSANQQTCYPGVAFRTPRKVVP